MNTWSKIHNNGEAFGPELIASLIASEFEGSADACFFEMHSDRRLGFRRLEDAGNDWNHLLELRVFDGEKELKIWRPEIGAGFYARTAAAAAPEVCFMEEQYLDIGSFRPSCDGYIEIVSTGGGRYTIPDSVSIDRHKDCKLTVCNYIDYREDTGQAEIVDWRIVGFKKGN